MQVTTTGGERSIVVRVDSGLPENISRHLLVMTKQVTKQVLVMTECGDKMATLQQYFKYNNAVGAPIQLLPQYSFCPVWMERDQRPVFLFQFIEVLDELIDYDEVKERLPELSFRQIGGAIDFIRKLSQFNLKGIDINDFINSDDATNQVLLNNLRSALSAQGEKVVLDIP